MSENISGIELGKITEILIGEVWHSASPGKSPDDPVRP